jgi:tRNA U34 5-methylaminomethyl-2-thiouridine-forming methyltransferase MnmC
MNAFRPEKWVKSEEISSTDTTCTIALAVSAWPHVRAACRRQLRRLGHLARESYPDDPAALAQNRAAVAALEATVAAIDAAAPEASEQVVLTGVK